MFAFSDILGQAGAIDTLRRAILADRLHHGLIFAGPPGVGKATTARALGQVFLCEQPAGDRPCGACPSCRVFEAGNHPDYHVLEKEHVRSILGTTRKAVEFSIDVVRAELIGPAQMKSNLGRGKVFVLEQAELLTIQAQNAALKILEEPAGRTVMMLLTDDASSLLPTIRSRCQVVRFGFLEVVVVRQELEKRGIKADEAAYAAAMSEGSLGLALRWVEDGVVAAAREMVHKLEALLAGRDAGDLPEWLRGAADAYAEKHLKRDPDASKDAAMRSGLRLYLRLCAQVLRRRLRQAHDGDDLDRLCGGIEAIVQTDVYLESNVNVALALQQLAVRLERLFLPYVHH